MSDLSGVQGALKEVRAREVTAGLYSGGNRRFGADIPVVGVGETIQQIWFPASYVEKPLHSWGFELVGGQTIAAGATPLATVMVRSWNTEIADSGVILYQGCRVALKIHSTTFDETEVIGTRFSFSLFFEGKSIAMPGR